MTYTMIVLIGLVVVGALVALMAVAALVFLREKWKGASAASRLLMVLIAVVVMGAVTGGAWLAAASRQGPPHTDEGRDEGWAVCAYDGLVLKWEDVGATAEHEGEILDFCNDDHKQRWIEGRDAYQHRWRDYWRSDSKRLMVYFTMMPEAQYADAMSDTVITVETPAEATHHLSVAVMAVPVGDPVEELTVAATLTAPGAAVTEVDLPLASDGTHYAADVHLSESGEYRVGVMLRGEGEGHTRYVRHVVR